MEKQASKNLEDMAMELDGPDNYLKNISANLAENNNRIEEHSNGKGPQSRSERNTQIQQAVEADISEISRKTIDNILEQIKVLTPTEHLLLYLKLPTECSNIGDPLRQPLNPLGSRSEISQTIMWIKTHLEEDPELSLPKQDVYNEYYAFCGPNKIKPLSTADFGKVMKQVYPRVRPRRLGTRGNSRYCYAGLRRRYKLDAPLLPDLGDKPQSSEFVSSSEELLSAAWTIIREWSEQQLGMQFSSFHSLAYYLVLNQSVGNGSTAASVITSSNKGYVKGDLIPSSISCNTKHREAQLQLQRKIQQKNEIIREQKRKVQMQSPKIESKGRSKKCKVQTQPSVSSNTSPVPGTEGESSASVCEELQPVCDKSLDFANLQSLPDFSSFQKMVANDQVCEYTNELYKPESSENANNVPGQSPSGKVPIPRLSSNINKFSPALSPQRPKSAKYKAIQPKSEPCDIGLCNQQPYTGDYRSQETNYSGATCEKKQKSAKKVLQDSVKTEIEDSLTSLADVGSEALFARERLMSVAEIDKSALDDYLGANNSQEHEEELVKYFENKDQSSDQDMSMKLTQLRQLLITQQNLESNTAQGGLNTVPVLNSNASAFIKASQKNMAQCYPKSFDGGNYSSEGARRRVSFETYHPEDAVPPSPNTRRKNFNFTPISPGSMSPTGRQSKCSSTNASPFVSPRNTPVPKAKGNIHQNVNSSYIVNQPSSCSGVFNLSNSQKSLISVKTNLKIKQEVDISNDPDQMINQISDSNEIHHFPIHGYLPMSAPPSPKMMKNRNSHLLQKLLNNKPPYSSRYQPHAGDNLSAEITHLLSSQAPLSSAEASYRSQSASYRSQSVPLHQMSLKLNQHLLSPAQENYYPSQFPFSTQAPTVTNEFGDFDSFNATENLNMNKILNTIDTMKTSSELNTFTNPSAVSAHNVGSHIDLPLPGECYDNRQFKVTQRPANVLPNLRTLERSQSIELDFESEFNSSLKCNPSRSVPTTPVPGSVTKFHFPRNRRSYTSTPLAPNNNFSFNHGHDYLLNGQPIKEKLSADNEVNPNVPYFQSGENNDEMYDNVDIFNVNDTNLSCDVLIGDNKNHFTFEGQLCDGNYNVNKNVPAAHDEINPTGGSQPNFKNGRNDHL